METKMPKHKFKVGDKVKFQGTVKIISIIGGHQKSGNEPWSPTYDLARIKKDGTMDMRGKKEIIRQS